MAITDKQLAALVQNLTLEEKAALCMGVDKWSTLPLPEKGIPSLKMADGPHGLRLEDAEYQKKTGQNSLPATCFPPQATAACSWDTSLIKEMGAAIAAECRQQGVHVLLGPGANIKRSPLCGRNFEYYAEDPLLSGRLAAAFINGVQGVGVGASLKHYAVNNQEKNRMSISAAVDERALFEIYLKAFEIAVAEAQPATVMASYNRVNGTYASESRRLLTDILRMQFGYKGLVVSDWSAVNERAAGVAAGMDLEMPASGPHNARAIVEAVQNGALAEDALDAAVWNILRLVFSYTSPTAAFTCNYNANHELAVSVLEKSAVLLKNEGVLPLQMGGRVAVIGEMAQQPRYQGAGSSLVNPHTLVSFLQAMDTAGQPYQYAPGCHSDTTSDKLLEEAAATARWADTVLLFIGLPPVYESEGYDRTHLSLPQAHIRLLEAVTEANPRVAVILSCGAPVETPWLDKAPALLCLHLGGEGSGEAARRLIFGEVSPAGKLTESWPLRLADTPCYHHFPGGPREVTYNESIYVGYRYYTTAKKPVQFPFGHGLNYTSFAYDNLQLPQNLTKGENLTVRFSLKNTGAVAGDEITQLYVACPASALFRPARELKAFTRIPLAAGESKTVTLSVPYADLACYDTASHSFAVEDGEYEVLIGSSSEVLPLCKTLHVSGSTLRPAPAFGKESPYADVRDNTFPPEQFAMLYTGHLEGNATFKKGEYTLCTPLGEMQTTLFAKILLWFACKVGADIVEGIADSPSATRAIIRAGVQDQPLKGYPAITNGRISYTAARAMLRLCNGRGGLFSLIRALINPEL